MSGDGAVFGQPDRALLAALAAALVPTDGVWPPADQPQIVDAAVAFAARTPARRAALAAVLARAAEAGVTDAGTALPFLVALEAEAAEEFSVLRTAVTVGYYGDPGVAATVTARCGMPAGPTMPHGLLALLPPSAAPDMSAVLAGGVRWRSDGTEIAAAVRAAQEQDPERSWTTEEIASWPR